MKDVIAWREGDNGSGDIRDVVTLMAMCDIEQFDPDEEVHPLMSYTSKAACLRRFSNGWNASMLKTLPILPDILRLHDQIVADAPAFLGSGAGNLRWVTA